MARITSHRFADCGTYNIAVYGAVVPTASKEQETDPDKIPVVGDDLFAASYMTVATAVLTEAAHICADVSPAPGV